MKRRNIIIGTVILFIITLYLVNYGPWSSSEIAKYNNGYGTFDMKSYNSQIVYDVLDHMEHKGLELYQKYFIGDYLFALVYVVLQLILLDNAFSWSKSKTLRYFFFIIPVVRGLCDLVENTSLLFILFAYPIRYEGLVNFTSSVTSLKQFLIYIWYALIVIGYMIKIIIKIKKSLKSHRPYGFNQY